MLELRYMLLAALCVLVLFISLITMKYRKLLRTREIEMSKEEVIGRLFLRKIRKVGESGGKEDPRELFNRLNKVMRSFFSELYEIAYEFAYVELNEELVKRGVEEDVRNAIIDYTMQIAEAEYSNHKMTDQEFFYLLEKSIKIIEKMTGKTEEEMEKREEVEEKLKSEKSGEARGEDEVAEEIRKELTGKKTGPSEGKKTEEEVSASSDEEKYRPVTKPEEELGKAKIRPEKPKKPEIPHKDEEQLEREMLVPKDSKEAVDRIRRLLLKAEANMKKGKPKECMDDYIDIRVIYDSLSPEIKMKINPETRRIITLYNSLLKEYKDILTDGK
jgi:hypothetical protein